MITSASNTTKAKTTSAKELGSSLASHRMAAFPTMTIMGMRSAVAQNEIKNVVPAHRYTPSLQMHWRSQKLRGRRYFVALSSGNNRHRKHALDDGPLSHAAGRRTALQAAAVDAV